MKYILLLAYRFLFKKKGSMITASTAVAATIFLIIFNAVVLGGVVNGVVRDLGDLNMGHISISNEKGLLKRPANQMITLIERNPEVLGAAPRLMSSVELNYTNSLQRYSTFGVQAIGIDPYRELDASRLADAVNRGEFLRLKGTVVLSEDISEELNTEIGSYIKVKPAGFHGTDDVRNLRVVGLFKVAGPIGLSETIIMHQDDLKELMGIDKIYTQMIMVRVVEGADPTEIKYWIQDQVRTDKWQKIETVDEWGAVVIEAYRDGIGFVNILAYSGMIASGLGVITILMMMVNSKIRDIGVLQALGMTGRKILLLFIIDGALLGILGAILGAIGGSAISLYLAENPVAFFSGLLPSIHYNVSVLPIPMMVGFSISVLASIYPAWRASQYQPEEAMRYV
ncbi:MAG: ABC transporter permease [Nitrososphaerales archaeon]